MMGGFFLLSCFISYLSIPLIIQAAKDKHLLDQPDGDRKLHTRAVPTLGGVAIFFAFLLSYAVSPWADGFEGFSYLVGALLILFFVGLKDDLFMLSARTKLSAQIAAVSLVLFGSGIEITNFYGVLGLADIPFWAAVPVTVFTMIVVINSMNLIDGIDGLAGGIGVIASLLFGAAFLYVGQMPLAMFSFCLAGALLGFLYYNFDPASIFMGDTGSIILGFLLSVQAIEFINLSSHPDFSAIFTNTAPILVVSILAFPLFDTLRVVFKRFRRANPIFEPGQDHVHHEMLRMGMTHKKASLLLYGQSFALIALMTSLSLFNISVNVLLGILLLTSMIIYPTNGFKRRMFANLFGVDWQVYRRRLWGVKISPYTMNPVNGNGNGSYKKLDFKVKKNGNGKKEERERDRDKEVERMAV